MPLPTNPKVVITAEQISKRIAAMGRQITDDYKGRTLHIVTVLENGFVFAADLVRALDLPMVCHFVRPFTREVLQGSVATTEIFYRPGGALGQGGGPARAAGAASGRDPAGLLWFPGQRRIRVRIWTGRARSG